MVGIYKVKALAAVIKLSLYNGLNLKKNRISIVSKPQNKDKHVQTTN